MKITTDVSEFLRLLLLAQEDCIDAILHHKMIKPADLEYKQLDISLRVLIYQLLWEMDFDTLYCRASTLSYYLPRFIGQIPGIRIVLCALQSMMHYLECIMYCQAYADFYYVLRNRLSLSCVDDFFFKGSFSLEDVLGIDCYQNLLFSLMQDQESFLNTLYEAMDQESTDARYQLARDCNRFWLSDRQTILLPLQEVISCNQNSDFVFYKKIYTSVLSYLTQEKKQKEPCTTDIEKYIARLYTHNPKPKKTKSRKRVPTDYEYLGSMF